MPVWAQWVEFVLVCLIFLATCVGYFRRVP